MSRSSWCWIPTLKWFALRCREIVRVERAERVRLLGQQNLRRVARAGILGVLLRLQRRQLRQERPVVVRERVQERRAERLAGGRIGHGGVTDELAAGTADDGTFAEPPPPELRVVEDARAAADDGRVRAAERPGETGRWREILVLLLRRTEVASIERREVLRPLEIVVEDVGFVFPAEAVVHREASA